MTILVIYHEDEQRSDLALTLTKKAIPYIECHSLKASFPLMADKSLDIRAIIVNYRWAKEETLFLETLAKDKHFLDIPLILILDDDARKEITIFKHTAPYHRLHMPFTEYTLHTTILNAENEFLQRRALRQEIKARESIIGAICSGTFRIKTFEEAEALTTMLSLACPEPDRIAFGLFELLANAIEHGNLEIDHEEKRRLMEKNCLRQEISRRLTLPEYQDRYVEIIFKREDNMVSFNIKDHGAGFNHNDYLDIDLAANQSYHGRGIALARMTSFDSLEYLGNGNNVAASAKFTAS